MTQRINYIDRMKGFAILMVVLAHVILFSFDMSDSLIFKFCASFEMPLFMFVSGFVAFIPGEIGGAALTKLRHRFISYVCPAFAVAYILALYKFLILDVLDKSLIDTLIGGLWYLKALAIFVCLQVIIMKSRKLLLELLVIVIAECLFLIGWKMNPFLHQLFCLEHCFFFYPFFMFGYYFRKYKLVDALKSRNWLFSLSVIGFICLLSSNFEVHALTFLSERIVRPVFAILAITYLFASREEQNSKLEQWFNNIGKKTLDIYIYHGTFILGTFSIFNFKFVKYNELMKANPISYLLLALLITLFLVYATIAIGNLVRKSQILGKIIYGK